MSPNTEGTLFSIWITPSSTSNLSASFFFFLPPLFSCSVPVIFSCHRVFQNFGFLGGVPRLMEGCFSRLLGLATAADDDSGEAGLLPGVLTGVVTFSVADQKFFFAPDKISLTLLFLFSGVLLPLDDGDVVLLMLLRYTQTF